MISQYLPEGSESEVILESNVAEFSFHNFRAVVEYHLLTISRRIPASSAGAVRGISQDYPKSDA